jgi:hypothetical protein
VKNLGYLLIIIGIIRLWIERRIKTPVAGSPVSSGMVKLDMPVLGSNVATTWILVGAGLFLAFRHKL